MPLGNHDVLNQAVPLDDDAALACALLAVDPVGLGGVALRAGAGPWRDAWLALLNRLLPRGTPVRRLPLNASDSALLGGLDLAATLSTGRPVAQQGLLAQADGGLLLVAMAERLPAGMVAHLAAALDMQEARLERDGLTDSRPARLALVALDEGLSDEEQLAPALQDRLAFGLQAPGREAAPSLEANNPWQASDIVAARALLPRVQVSDQIVQALCATALMLGVDSLRGSLLALRAARAAAALAGLDEVDDSHATLAARLVLAPRATRLPPAAQAPEAEDTPPTEADQPPESQEPPQDAGNKPDESPDEQNDEQNDEKSDEQALPNAEDLQALMVLAAQAAIPPGLLAALQAGQALRQAAARGGRVGAVQKNQRRGRPIGSLRGEPRAGARLQVLDTLRAAAPWQKIRQRDLQANAAASVGSAASTGAATSASTEKTKPAAPPVRRIQVRREDFHVMRYKQNRPTTTIFAVDASGSSALHRLAEAKGAVELLLADCYVRRDRVAVLAFRGTTAELLLPPTRSLARAKRSLAALPGGGGTPLAHGIEASTELARQIARSGDTPVVVLLTDGRANIARDGAPGRGQAGQDALAAARQFAAAGLTALLIDTSPQPQAVAQALAQAMGATYVPLPHAGAQGLSQAVRLVSGQADAAGRAR